VRCGDLGGDLTRGRLFKKLSNAPYSGVHACAPAKAAWLSSSVYVKVKSKDQLKQELIIEERVSNCAMGYQKCGPKVYGLPLSLQERC